MSQTPFAIINTAKIGTTAIGNSAKLSINSSYSEYRTTLGINFHLNKLVIN
ncbi:MAG TPA: hypothetical protein VJ772_01770 [Nitrososphaeraceae archaeon]|jgi:hypothetical protein|nr:hypothetical protein [Nitrososphaeraceae archaeon]